MRALKCQSQQTISGRPWHTYCHTLMLWSKHTTQDSRAQYTALAEASSKMTRSIVPKTRFWMTGAPATVSLLQFFERLLSLKDFGASMHKSMGTPTFRHLSGIFAPRMSETWSHAVVRSSFCWKKGQS